MHLPNALVSSTKLPHPPTDDRLVNASNNGLRSYVTVQRPTATLAGERPTSANGALPFDFEAVGCWLHFSVVIVLFKDWVTALIWLKMCSCGHLASSWRRSPFSFFSSSACQITVFVRLLLKKKRTCSKVTHVQCCPLKISLLLNCLCVWIKDF